MFLTAGSISYIDYYIADLRFQFWSLYCGYMVELPHGEALYFRRANFVPPFLRRVSTGRKKERHKDMPDDYVDVLLLFQENKKRRAKTCIGRFVVIKTAITCDHVYSYQAMWLNWYMWSDLAIHASGSDWLGHQSSMDDISIVGVHHAILSPKCLAAGLNKYMCAACIRQLKIHLICDIKC